MKMEKQNPTSPKSEEVSQGRGKPPYVFQAGSIGEFSQRNLGDPVNEHTGKGSLALAQWEVQWQEFLRTLDTPQSGWGIRHLPEKPSPWENAKAFLASFEQVAEACQWPKEEWVTHLLPALSGEAEKAFDSLDVRNRRDYGKVKAAILRGEALSREKQREQFRHFCYQEAEGPREAYSRLQEMCHEWLRVENHSKEQILELLVLEQLLNVLPLEIQSQVRESSPESCSHAVALAEEFLSRHGKQVPLEEAAWSISKVGQDPSECEQRYPSMAIKEEDREESPLADVEKQNGELQGISSEESLEIPILEEKRKSRNKDLSAQERFHITKKENESLEFGHSFSQSMILVSQEQIHLIEKPYRCLECGESFTLRTDLTSHQRIHPGDNQENKDDGEPYHMSLDKGELEELRNQGGSKKQKGYHMIDQKDQPIPFQEGNFNAVHPAEETYKCLQCGMNFSDQTQYNMHLQIHSKKKTHKCSICGKSFNWRSNLQQHQRTHTGEKPFECSECGKKFTRSCTLQQHRRTHTGEKPFQCSECGKSFHCNGYLHQHQRIHIKEKPFECSECGKRFGWRRDLQRHQGIHTEEKTFECSECGKRFGWSRDLKRHQRIHTEEKPFECSDCGMKFWKSYGLQQHRRTHTGEKPFECSECGKSFNCSSNLHHHRRTHTGEKPHQCLECGKKFSHKCHLKKHQRIHMRRNRVAHKEETSDML